MTLSGTPTMCECEFEPTRRGVCLTRSTPFMLDSYESEYEEQCREQNKHALELDQLRNANRNLSAQV